MPDVTATLEGISSLMENDIEKKVEVRNWTVILHFFTHQFKIGKINLKF
jgi:hypothetical protein